uniref:G_PROTEIN_RECEP_F1_2 domain-containing protein n=1 Tax=Ascaris lumbricoides TaxID=6252 RepID=A0A0M3IPK2_ASCLU
MTNPVRDAIYAMMIIVTTYLISNSLHLILTILERSKSSLLRDPMDANMASTFHTVFSDTVSFVYMFTSAIRLIIYCICDPTTRNDVKRVITICQQENKKSILVPTCV